jgi:iron complex outermembrane receptor protein
MRPCLLLIGVSAVVLPLSDAGAQEPAAPSATAQTGLEEVVVTAERRSENLQNVPVTVTAINKDQMVAAGVKDLMTLSTLVPSFSSIDPTGFTMSFIRGIGSSTLGGGTFSSVATYIDGVYIARTTNGMLEFDGAESLQVLAGPQGSLYGRNATAGAVVLSTETAEPGSELTGTVNARLGNYNSQDWMAKFGGGIGERWSFNLAAAKHDHDGYVENLNPAGSIHTEDLDDRDSVSARAGLLFEPNDTMSFALRAQYAKSSDHSGGGYEPVGVRAGTPEPVPGCPDIRSVFFGIGFGAFGSPALGAELCQSVVFAPGFRQTYDNQRSGFDNGLLFGESKPGSSLFIENTLVSLNASFDFDGWTLRSVTGYTDSDYHGSVQVGLEAPGSATLASLGGLTLDANGGLGFSSTMPSEVFSQSFQFLSNDDADIKWIGGVDYSKEDGKVFQTGDTFGQSAYSSKTDLDIETEAAFAQVTIPFGLAWSTTLGGRYSQETYDIRASIAPFTARSKDSSKFTYTARLERKGDGWLAYGGVSSGFKSATLNPGAPSQGEAEPEEVTSAEIGLKKDFGSSVRLNTSIYYATYEGIQLQAIEQATGGNFLTNGPDAESKGIDIQADARITDNFTLSVGATLLDAEFTEDKPADPVAGTAGLAIEGNRLPGSAEFAASLVGDYTFNLASGAVIDWSTTYVYNSGKWYEHWNLVGSGGTTDKSYDLWHMALTFKSANDHWSAGLWGNNLLDEEYYRTGIAWAGDQLGLDAIAGTPRTYGVDLTYKF